MGLSVVISETWYKATDKDAGAVRAIRTAANETGKDHIMSDLVVIAFPSEAKAEEVRHKILDLQKDYLIWHSPDNRECAKRVSLISCRDIGHSSYTGIIFRIARLLRLRLPRCGAAVVLRHTKTSDMGGSRTGQDNTESVVIKTHFSLSFCSTHDDRTLHAGAGLGGGRRSAIIRRMSAKRFFGMATSAI